MPHFVLHAVSVQELVLSKKCFFGLKKCGLYPREVNTQERLILARVWCVCFTCTILVLCTHHKILLLNTKSWLIRKLCMIIFKCLTTLLVFCIDSQDSRNHGSWSNDSEFRNVPETSIIFSGSYSSFLFANFKNLGRIAVDASTDRIDNSSWKL